MKNIQPYFRNILYNICTIYVQYLHINSKLFVQKGTVHHVVGDEKTTVTMVSNKNLWLEINANTSSNECMPARHRSL